MSEGIYRTARHFLDNHDYVLNNVYMFNWESDLFGISSSGYAVEVEVKISRSDFNADFKKQKHGIFEKAFNEKNEAMKQAFIEVNNPVPNRFYFACPFGMITPDQVPPYAGLIYCESKYTAFDVIKKAPFIHKYKLDLKERLLSKYYHTSLNTRSRLQRLLYDIRMNNTTDLSVEKEIMQIIRFLK